MQRLIFESSPAFIILCIAMGIGYAWLLYKNKHTWGKTTNRILFFRQGAGSCRRGIFTDRTDPEAYYESVRETSYRNCHR